MIDIVRRVVLTDAPGAESPVLVLLLRWRRLALLAWPAAVRDAHSHHAAAAACTPTRTGPI